MEQLSTPSKTRAPPLTSPKRKRDQNDECPSVPSRLRTQLPSQSGAADEAASPRSTVVSQFQALGLHHDSALPSFRSGSKKLRAEKASELREEGQLDAVPLLLQENAGDTNDATGTSPLTQPATAQLVQLQDSQSALIQPISTAAFDALPPSLAVEEIPPATDPPATPLLKPSTPSITRTISPLPTTEVGTSSIPPVFLSASNSNITPRTDSTADSPPPSKRMHMPIRPHSPPPSPLNLSTMLTSVSSIKSTSSEDSLDEALGLNGIGFRPTPAVAYARAQRRKQQVAEWKSREAREARQRRSERRRSSGIVPTVSSTGKEAEGGMAVEGRRRVRFVEN